VLADRLTTAAPSKAPHVGVCFPRLTADSARNAAPIEIARRAVDILKWRVGLPADRINVKVEKGIVTLTGDVNWRFQKNDAEAAIHNLAGVVGVANLIRVYAPVQLPEVREKIQKALHRSADLDASRITVQIDGGRVVLGGKVHAWYERDIAERAAWSAPGVTEVQDRIKIEP